MKTLLSHLYEKLRSSFWVTPAACGVAAVILAQVLLGYDSQLGNGINASLPYLSSSSPDGVRSILSTVATSMLTLAGLTFSATLVALTLTSGQFGPRLLRNFIRSRTNQMTLGMLLATFVYCLIVLRRVSDEFIPHLAALGGFLLALAGLCLFIVFVHSLVTSMQAEEIVAAVYQELDEAVERIFPDSLPSSEEERQAEEDHDDWEEIEEEHCIESSRVGYLQAIDLPALVRLSTGMETRFRVMKRPGQFIQMGTPLVAIHDHDEFDPECSGKILDCFLIGRLRTAEQDFEYSVRQLVEVALRALSPGINDPFTAITCIDFLSAALCKISGRKLPQRIFHDDDGHPRVLTRPASFQSTLNTAFLQIRQAGTGKPDVIISLLRGLEGIATSAVTQELRETVWEHARIVAEDGLENISIEFDRDCIQSRLEGVKRACEKG